MEIEANDQDENGNEGSGIDKYYYMKGTKWEELTSTKLPTLESEGIISISVKAVDKAGKEETHNFTIKKDSKPPEFTMEKKIEITNKTAYGFTATTRATDPRPRKHGPRPSIKPSNI